MRISLGLPTHKVDAFDEFCSAAAITEMARVAEAGGLDAVFVTEHPIPANGWLGSGGHHALDPFVALSFAAAATTTLRLHTNLLILAYRNPFLSAKAVATLDALSGGRVILGVGAGYLEGEFAALGVDFDARNDLTDEAIVAMRRAWTGESVVAAGRGWSAAGNTARPTPVQQPGPPIWIGGNSKRAIRRVVDLADGWMPMPSPAGSEARLKTPAIASLDELRERLDYAHEYAAHVGRRDRLRRRSSCRRGSTCSPKAAVDPGPVVDGIRAMAEVGVTYCSLTVPGDTRAEFLANVDVLATHVVPAVADLCSDASHSRAYSVATRRSELGGEGRRRSSWVRRWERRGRGVGAEREHRGGEVGDAGVAERRQLRGAPAPRCPTTATSAGPVASPVARIRW